MYIIIHDKILQKRFGLQEVKMKISNIDINFRLRSLLPKNNAENYVKAKQKYADTEYIVQMKDSINNTSEFRSNQVMRDLGLF